MIGTIVAAQFFRDGGLHYGKLILLMLLFILIGVFMLLSFDAQNNDSLDLMLIGRCALQA